MHKRINVTLPVETIRLIERVTSKGNRSRFIDQAVQHYVDTTGRAILRRRLEEGARAQPKEISVWLRNGSRSKKRCTEMAASEDTSAWRCLPGIV